MVENQQGVLILGSHLGNIELCRALGRQTLAHQNQCTGLHGTRRTL